MWLAVPARQPPVQVSNSAYDLFRSPCGSSSTIAVGLQVALAHQNRAVRLVPPNRDKVPKFVGKLVEMGLGGIQAPGLVRRSAVHVLDRFHRNAAIDALFTGAHGVPNFAVDQVPSRLACVAIVD